jgi:hypothetical protein
MALLFAGASFDRSVFDAPLVLLAFSALPEPGGSTSGNRPAATTPGAPTGRAFPEADRSLTSHVSPSGTTDRLRSTGSSGTTRPFGHIAP